MGGGRWVHTGSVRSHRLVQFPWLMLVRTSDEPRKARTPLRKKTQPSSSGAAELSISIAAKIPRNAAKTISRITIDSTAEDPLSIASPVLPQIAIRTPRTPKQPRMTKKAQAEAEQAKRAAYAEQLFAELNHTVFKDGLRADTKLVWNTRLLTTAGKARWHKSSDGTRTSSIELATKILDCEERIRHTLSHEMCHLACWIIDNDKAEGHGPVWNKWAWKVMRYRPDIEISV
ncbi:hypothetical protein OE88DRAFT_161860 [Heliocybe sulcata]|uniref:SprT-like domain-containing protein n=1 Tax=Heliocybe sulcata TaxID=5364 RepID=A0A5C3NKC8_9AGAM|nr:hypothetical protein OE88DRAFT_161860 [Heliocybe sulcata]